MFRGMASRVLSRLATSVATRFLVPMYIGTVLIGAAKIEFKTLGKLDSSVASEARLLPAD
jgi:hypothetical protein